MITKIVLTGGPCAGKTSAIQRIRERFETKGYAVLSVSEAATELIFGGVAPWTCRTSDNYQKWQMKLQIEKEKIFYDAALDMPAENILILCDRGIMDNRAYMDEESFWEMFGDMGLDEEMVYKEYDAIFHLDTAAKGVKQYYTLSNNGARKESASEAAALDDRILAAWEKHPYRVIIDNSTDFEGKIGRLIHAIEEFLKE